MKINKGKISFSLSNKNRRISLQGIFYTDLFVLALLALISFAGCNATITPPVNEEKKVVDLNTPEVEMNLVGATPAVTFIELANYNGKLIGVSLIDFLVDYTNIKNYIDLIKNTKEIDLVPFLGFYTKDQVRQSIINGFPGIAYQQHHIQEGIEQGSWIYRIIDAFNDYGEFFKANDPYQGDDFKMLYSDWEKYNYEGSKYAPFFIMYNPGEDPFKDFSEIPIEIENWPEFPPDVN